MAIPYTTTQYKKQYQPSQAQKQMQNYASHLHVCLSVCLWPRFISLATAVYQLLVYAFIKMTELNKK